MLLLPHRWAVCAKGHGHGVGPLLGSPGEGRGCVDDSVEDVCYVSVHQRTVKELYGNF